MFNLLCLLWLCVCLLLPATLGEISSSNSTNATDVATVAAPLGGNISSSDLLPSAEKLTRLRRHPYYTLRKSSKRSKHRSRNKHPAPKTRYGPPSYHPAPPISYYKPTQLEEPSFSLDDFQHLKFDGTDFHLPASSYEAQSMDLDLYSHQDQDLYGAHKFPSLEYSFGDEHESPPLSSYEHKPKKPHQKYGVPPVHQSIPSISYGAPDAYAPHPYEPAPPPPVPSTKYGVPVAPSTKYGVPEAPSTKYGVPEAPVHVPNSYSHPAPPPSSDSYSIYEQKIPNVGYHQSFAEPPQGPPKHSPNFEISHSPPAYEISTSYQETEPQYEQSYHPPAGNDYQPPPPPPPPDNSYHPPAEHDYQPPAPSPGHSYQPPAGGSYQPPAGGSYQPPAPAPDNSYHPPASPPDHGYQPPDPSPGHSYQPPASPPVYNYEPPHDFAEPPSQHQPASSYGEPDTHQPVQSYPHENYAPPSEELPLSPNHKFPSFDYPKSSYEVPIYDPIPFEASNKEELESYPPILTESSSNSNELPSDDTHAAGSARAPAKSRKRKRRPSTTDISKKHTLDVPELQQAYDEDSHVYVRGTDLDTAAHGSRHIEQKRKFVNFVTPPTTTTTTTAPWSPMRFRSTTSNAFIPTILTTTPPPSRTRFRGTSRFRTRNPSTEAVSTVVTIEKSRSQSYYDGTLPPPTYQPFTVQTGRASRPTRPPLSRVGGGPAPLALLPGTERNPTLKRTTKGVFDTTLFKTPQSDREMERTLHALRQNLPKNHKLY